jgi:hypothetical protein
MAVSTQEIVDVAQALEGLLEGIDGLRVVWFVSDASRPPFANIGLPDIDYADQNSGFCAARWEFPVTLVVTRSNDRQSQRDLSRLLAEIVTTLNDADIEGVFSITPLDARPTTATVGGQDLPGYTLRVAVRA